MKWIIYLALLLGVTMLPTEGTDVGKLIPVEVIAVSEDRGIITIETDTGDTGQGRSIEDAVYDMEDTASGIIYLDTAEYLILEEGIPAKAMRPYLKGSVRVCAGEGMTLDGIAEYLSIHKPKRRLDEDTNVTKTQVITEENGRFRLS